MPTMKMQQRRDSKAKWEAENPILLPGEIGVEAASVNADGTLNFTTGPGATTLPIKIYSQVRLGVTPEINAACTILIAIVTIGVIIASIATKRREYQRQRDEHLATTTVG